MEGNKLNPNAPVFTPGSTLPEPQQKEATPEHQPKKATPKQGPVSLNPHAQAFIPRPGVKPSTSTRALHCQAISPHKNEIDEAFNLLKSSPKKAEQKFRRIIGVNPHEKTAVVGLARSLFEQGGSQHYREAEQLLIDFKSKNEQRAVGGQNLSSVKDLDMTLVRVFGASGQWLSAQKLLQTMARDQKRDLPPDDWTTPCGNHTIDITRARLQEDKGHYEDAGKLLQAMARNHKSTLATEDSTTPCGNHTIDITRVRLHQDRGYYEDAGKLLQAMAGNHKSTLATDDWTTPCGNPTIDLARVRLHQDRGHYENAGKLLQAMAGNHKRTLHSR